mgnify:CR=1 FL=1
MTNQPMNTLSRRHFIIGGTAALGCAMFMNPASAFADTADDKQAEADAAYANLTSMQQSLDKASNDYGQALMDQESAEAAMNDAQTSIDEESQKISDYQDQLGTRAKGMYRTGSNTFIDVLLGSSTFEEFTTNWGILNSMNEKDAQLVSDTKTSREALEAAREQYATQAQVAAQKTQEAKDIKDQASSTVTQMQGVYDSLSAEASSLLAQRRAAQEAAAQAQAAAVVAASATSAAGNTTGAQAQAATTDTGNDGGGAVYDNGSDNDTGGSSYDDGGSSSSGSGSYGGNSAVVDRAYSCLGIPYSWGACSPNAFDCSGLVSYCLTGSYSRLGTTYTFLGWPQVSDPQPGDVCTSSEHCGIYIGNGQMIHAPCDNEVVKIGPVQSGMIIVRY